MIDISLLSSLSTTLLCSAFIFGIITLIRVLFSR